MGGACGKRKYTPNTESDVLEETINKTADVEKIQDSGQSFLVGEISAVRDDKFTEVKITEDKSVLVAKCGQDFYAIGAKCPHAGASLINGILINGKVRCPWHAACFDLKTGDLEDFPGFDCIPSYPVKQNGSNLYVQVDPKTMVDRRLKPMTKLREKKKTVVIIGSGPCGYSCAQTLREEGYDGKIVLVTADSYLPYDRTKLTKKLGCVINDIQIRSQTFYEDNGIDILVEASVQSVDVQNRSITFQNNSHPSLTFDYLFMAVGMTPRHYSPRVQGDDLENIYTLHSLKQHIEVIEKAKGKEVVLVGSSFISMELAELLSPIASKIHVLSRSRVPYNLAFGESVGQTLLTHFSNKLQNVTFYPQTEVKYFVGNDTVTGVITTQDETIDCQVVVVAIGGLPNTKFLEGTEIQLHPTSRSILVNEYLETNIAGIFGGGDVVTFPFELAPSEEGTVAHWQLASRHGRIAGMNILGRKESTLKLVPFFWTNVCGLQVRYLGYGEAYDETLIYGNPESLYFCIVYRRNQRLTAVCCIGCDNLASELALIFQNNMEWISVIPEAITKRFPNN